MESAYSDCEGVNEELTNWKDGLQGTNLENSEKYSRIEEAIELIESVVNNRVEMDAEDGSDLSKFLESSIEVTYWRPKSSKGAISRGMRLENAASYLRDISQALQTWADEHDSYADVESWINDLEEHADTLESVEVPGMFG